MSADPGSFGSISHSQVSDSYCVEIDGGGVFVGRMYPEDPVLVAALDDEAVQEDLVLGVIGPKVRKEDVGIAELGDVAFEAVKR